MESQRKAAINLMNSWLINSDNFVILDTETTGLDEHDEIVEVAVIDMSGKVLLNTLVNPIQPIPYEATQIHGITNDDVKTVPRFDIVWNRHLKEILSNKIILCYNSDFDIRMIYQSLEYYDVDYVDIKSECVMLIYTHYCNSDRWISLENASNWEGVSQFQNHRALDDCKLTLGVIKSVAENYCREVEDG